MKKLITLLAFLVVAAGFSFAADKVVLAKPSKKQLMFQDWEVGAFIHYDLNVFTGQEHGDGLEPPSKFNPTNLDAEQWVLTAKKLGAKYACLTVRHEGGFCLWPTKTTDYSIANSPYKNGKGDIVRDFVNACRKHGIVPCFYHTAAFDANAVLGKYYKGNYKRPLQWTKTWSAAQADVHREHPELKEQIKKMQVEQMRELLTNYGPIGFMWSDHWDATDPNGVWRAVTDLARKLQPKMVFMGPDTWVPGNETGNVVYPMWNAVNTVDGTVNSRPADTKASSETSNNYGLLETDALTGHPLGKFWRPRECTTNTAFCNGGWFWHPGKTSPKEHWKHIDLYYRTVGLGANTIINLPPDNRGLIPDDVVAAAEKFGNEIKNRFAHPFAETKKTQKGDIVEISWKTPALINTVMTMEDIKDGQKVAQYTLQAFVNGEWTDLVPENNLIARKPYNPHPGFETIGHKKIDTVKPVTTNRIRFKCIKSIAKPVEIRKLAVYYCEPYRVN